MKTVEDPKKRAVAMLALREMGWTLERIGEIFELSRERVRQILAKEARNG